MIKPNQKIIIDAKDAPLGRTASFAAKQALLGKEVKVVNCNEAIVTGKRKSILDEYRRARSRGGAILKGPNFPKSPERIMKRTIRGMLKYKRERGALAFKMVRCYNDVPEELKNYNVISLKKNIRTNSLKLKEISSLI